MKKIGVVSNVEYRGINLENICTFTDSNTYIHITNLSLTMYDEKNRLLKNIDIEMEYDDYNSANNNLLYLGDLVEYDFETKKFQKVTSLDKDSIKEIEHIQKKYIDRITILKENDFVIAISKCSSIEEVKQLANILKYSSEFEKHMYKIKINDILTGINENLKLIGGLDLNKIKSSLDDINLIEIINRLGFKMKMLSGFAMNNEAIDYNKLLTYYMMYNYYIAIAKSRNVEIENHNVNLDTVKQLLKENEMLPINSKSKKILK